MGEVRMPQAIQTAAFWEASVEGYERASEPFTARFCEDAAARADLAPGLHLLDVAAGPGALALAAARRGATVTAIDFAPAMTRRLAERAQGLAVTARTMDGQALDFADASFDRVGSVLGVSLFPDWQRGLSEMVRVLRPGGRAVVVVAGNPHGFGPNSLFAAARAAIVGPFAPTLEGQAQLADAAALIDALAAAGLVDVRVEPRTHEFHLPLALLDADHPMIGQNPILAGLAAAERAAVVAEARRLAGRHVEAGMARLPGTALLATGRRPG
jgi:SAM-dependent methyltransferase